jgi:cell wall-associated NlpC family hydrolase
VLAQISQIQTTIASGAPAASDGFASVLAQVSSPSPAVGAGSSGAPDLSDSYGWPLEEGRNIYPANPSTVTNVSGPPVTPADPRVRMYRVKTENAVPAATGAGSGTTAAGAGGSSSALPANSADIGQEAVTSAQKYLGVPYLWGGTNPKQGVDCSGLVQDVYAGLGVALPRTSQEQATVGVAVPSLAEAEPGDLVFFPGSDGTAAAPGHVGIYIGNGQMIDAPYTGADVRVDPVGNPTEIRRVSGMAPDQSGPSPVGAATTLTGSSATASTPTTSTPSTAAASGAPTPGGTGPVTAYEPEFAAAAATYGVPETLLKAVASTESSFEPGAVSGAGAEGLMQLMPSVAASLGVNPFDPDQAIGAAAKLLSGYHTQFGSWSLALAAYNAGPAAVEEHAGVPPYPQTTAYVGTVLSTAGMQGS